MKRAEKIIAVITIIILALSLVGCNAEKEATEAFDTMMAAFKSGDREQISEYFNFDEESKIIDGEVSDGLYDVVLSTLSKMDYKIKSTEKLDGDSVKFNVVLTTVDFEKIMEFYINSIMEMVASTEYQAKISSMTQEEYQEQLTQLMVDVLENPEISTMEHEVDITMRKVDGVWVPGPEKDDFIKSVFSSLMDAVNSLV